MSSSPSRASLLANLYGTQKPSIDSDFEDLLSRKINIAPGIRSKASDSQNHLREFLSKERHRDTSFPPVLSRVDADFLGGSFARHTKNWPLDDIDVYVPLDGHGLFYYQNGLQLPFLVQSDGGLLWNPLLGSRWANGMYVSSAKVVWEFAAVLSRHYQDSDVRANGNCVSVRLKHGKTANNEGLGYDVVPCFSLKPRNTGEFEFYLIPDGNGGWIRTNPRFDTIWCEMLQTYHNKVYRKVVKLVKFWNENFLSRKFSSYYIEFAVCREFWGRKAKEERVSAITEGLAAGFDALARAFEAGHQTPWIDGAPAIQRPVLTPYDARVLSLARTTSGLAWINERLGKSLEARKQWAAVFGDAFQG